MSMAQKQTGATRREMLQIGALGGLGLSLASYLQKLEAGEVQDKAKSAIVVWLGGGPPHLDTFDMKPDAPAEIRGEHKPIKTTVPGIEICEHLPRLAKLAKEYAILRGVSHTLAGHQPGTEYLSTGNRPVPSLQYPGYGSVVSKEVSGAKNLPHFVAVPGTPQKPGYLGVQYAPLSTNDTPKAGKPFGVRGISLSNGMTVEAFQKRQKLLKRLDTTFDELKSKSHLIEGLDRFAQQAYSVISSPQAREAFDTGRESPQVAAQFGEHRFGQSCLLAARLIGAGVRFATVTFSGWDTHSNNFRKTKESLLPQLDQGLSGLISTLDQRGLLKSTTILVTGEFGRTPKINKRAGRDHWPRAFSVLMAGGGVQGGQVLGASDDKGMAPKEDAISPEQIAATFYHTLGIDPQKEYHTRTGRPVMIVRSGSVLEKLFH